MRMRLAVLPELLGRLTARAWAGGEVETLDFRSASGAEVFVVSGRLLPRTDGEEGGALGVLWLRLDGLFTRDEQLAFGDFRRLGVRADQIEALLASEVAARLPMLDCPLQFGSSETDLMAWTGWGAPEGFGRWTVGAEFVSGSVDRPREMRRLMPSRSASLRFSAQAGRSSLRFRLGRKRLAVFNFPKRPKSRAAPFPAAS